MRRNSVNTASGLKTAVTFVFSDMVSVKETFRHLFTAHAHKRLFRSSRSKIWPCCSLRRPRFPIRQVYFHYQMTFAAYIWCFRV